ncbi:hypothetical protein F4560_006382 [Saccharothrix ecbatanensis]|uniref:Uncharacterized protein n=1 Tax=Saccharothrix ecbatanensis TaxID=1105145 RepID=A0A7W9HQK7_9PSEU|nr:hypothetical protein [Saccharothrix ecbatanensis]MBB5806614.1 hypothetical protein [Saccharothrix ecbatanensis]
MFRATAPRLGRLEDEIHLGDMMRKIALMLACLALTGCSNIEADPTFLVLGVYDTTYEVNVVSGRPRDLRADNWHRQHVDKGQFATEVQEGDHVICHLEEAATILLTDCRKTELPTSSQPASRG